MHHYYSNILCLGVNINMIGILINYTTHRIMVITIKGTKFVWVDIKAIKIIFQIQVKTVNLLINLSYPSNYSSIYPYHNATKCRHKNILK